MRQTRWIRPAVVVAGLSLLVAACTVEEDPTGPEEPDAGGAVEDADADEPEEATDDEPADAPQGDPIRIGGTLGLTGAFAEPSAGYLAAYEYWEERINAEGGLLGRPVELLIYDDESTPTVAQDLFQRLIDEDEVDLLLAPYTTAVGGAVIPIIERNEMVLWNGGFVGIELFENSDWLVGSFTYQDPEYARPVFELVESLPEDERPERVAIVTEQNPFTLVVRGGFGDYPGAIERAESLGMEVVLDEQYAPDTTDVSGLVRRAMDADADMFLALSLPNPAALFARTAHELGYTPDIYCSCGSQVTTVPFWKDLGEAADGVMGTTMSWPTDDYPELDELHEVLQEEFGWAEMPTYAAGALSILQVLEQAVEAVGEIDQAALRDYVTDETFETAVGPMQYDEHRVPAYNAALVQFVGDHNEVVWPEDRATAQPRIPMR
jgi:branched-chain amino acid transport system substrate-binding protein